MPATRIVVLGATGGTARAVVDQGLAPAGIAEERLALRGLPQISRADLATFLLAQIDDRTYIRTGVLISA
jgi:hypothetical protein